MICLQQKNCCLGEKEMHSNFAEIDSIIEDFIVDTIMSEGC